MFSTVHSAIIENTTNPRIITSSANHIDLTLDEAAVALGRMARKVWRRQALRLLALALAGVAPVTIGLGMLGGWSPVVQGLVGVVLMGGALAPAFAWLKRKGISAALVAAHLDRTTTALEESTALLLRPPETLRLIDRLQQRRVLGAFRRLARPLPTPSQGLHRAGMLAGLSVLVSGAMAVWMPRPFAEAKDALGTPIALHAVADSTASQTPVRIEAARVTVTPPSYAGLAPTVSDDLNIEALQQARASWVITLNQPVEQAAFVFNDGDTLALRVDGSTTYRADKPLRYSGYYYLACTSAGQQRFRSDFFAISIIEDLPPVFTVVRPEPRTLIEPGEPASVALTVLADDDLGLREARLVATVSSGSGENVKFREQALAFDAVAKESATRWTLTKSLDLEALGMTWGDELFFFVEGWDHRAPDSNRGRSETLFVVLKDTSQWAAAPGITLALSPAEDYLRSQRQIIIDTEKLLADQPGLGQDVFRQRSNNIGIDQKLLRLQYGQFLGEEFETTVTEAERLIPELAGAEDEGHDEHDHADGIVVETSPDAVAEIIEQYGHAHDTEEGATFYSEDIKRELKAALAEMWEAELHLRMYGPEEALPYEYRALRILKALQQKARIYVKRIGFEPPAINPDEARLTGDLDDVPCRNVQRQARPEASFPAIREALALLPALAQEPEDAGEQVAVLERAGSELAGVAIEEAGRYLSALQALRTLIDTLDNADAVCRSCIPVVRRAFWNVLPLPEALPEPRREGATSLSHRYFKQLGR